MKVENTAQDTPKSEEEVRYLCPFKLAGRQVECKNRIYRVGTKRDCFQFRQFSDSLEGFVVEHSEKDKCVIWSKKVEGEPLNIIKCLGFYAFAPPGAPESNQISCELLYDMLQDAEFREVWDDFRAEAFTITMLDPCTEIGYYAGKSPVPMVSARDFVNQRQWHAAGRGEYVIWNTSVPHDDVKEDYQKTVRKKINGSFVRAISKVTGYFIFPWLDSESGAEKGVCMTYITQSDLRGSIPTSLCNYITKKVGPKTLKKVENAMRQYSKWREAKIKEGTYKKDWESPKEWWAEGLNVVNDGEEIRSNTFNAAQEYWRKHK